MIEVSEVLKTAYKRDSVHKNLVIRFLDGSLPDITNSNIIAESMELDEILCDEEQLRFGLCNASKFTVQVANINVNIKGKDIAPVLIVNSEEIPLGIFTIQSVEKVQGTAYKTIVGIDYMDLLNIDVSEWYKTLTFPISVANLRNGLFNYIGLEQVSTELLIDSIEVAKINSERIIGLDIMQPICELNGSFGHINRQGKFEYISLNKSNLYPSDNLYPDDELFPSGATDNVLYIVDNTYNLTKSRPVYEDYTTDEIEDVSFADQEGALYWAENGNAYRIDYNYIFDGQSTDTLALMASKLLNKIRGIYYRPVSVLDIKGQPYMELGDEIFLPTPTDIIETFILTRRLTGIQNLTDSITSPGSERFFYDKKNLRKQVENIDNKTEEVKKDLNNTKVNLSKTQESIIAEVVRATEAEEEIQTAIEVTNKQIVMKIDDNGKIYAVALQDLAGKGVEFKVNANNINLSASDIINLMSNGELNLTGKNIKITSTNFNVDKDGNVTGKNSKFINGYFLGDLTAEGKIYMKEPFSGNVFPLISLHYGTESPYISFNDQFGNPLMQFHTLEGQIYYNKDYYFGPAEMQPI